MPGEPAPGVAVPADDALDLAPAFEADQRRHGLDAMNERMIECGIIDDVFDVRGKGGIVLGNHLEAPHAARHAPDHRLDQRAGGAGALGEQRKTVWIEHHESVAKWNEHRL